MENMTLLLTSIRVCLLKGNEMNLVLTIAIGSLYHEMAMITHPSIKRYADKIGAEFKVIADQSHSSPHWEKFEIYDLLSTYERILYVDTDVLITSDCPDLFEIVPKHLVGAFNEGAYFERKYPEYFNTGVMIIPRCCRNIFMKPETEQGSIETFYEQNFLNDRIQSGEYPVHPLSHKFNKMDFIQAPGYIIHKAGNLNALAELRELASVLA